VVAVARADGSDPLRRGVANYGLRPTVETSLEPLLEVHVLEECPYGAEDRLRVEWLAFLRPEQRFSGFEELKAQIARDRDAALAWFGD
jgi:riboflavin kinase/FMN adenylyltransferase